MSHLSRVLVVVHGFPPRAVGGAEQRAERTVRGLRARGVDVRVLVAADPAEDIPPEECVGGTVVRTVTVEGGRRRGPSASSASFAAALQEEIGRWRPDLIHQFSGFRTSASVARVAAAHGVPLVVSLTDFWWLCHRITMQRADGVMCASPGPGRCAFCHLSERRWVGWSLPWSGTLGYPLSDTLATLPLVGRAWPFSTIRDRAREAIDALGSAAATIAPSRFLAARYREAGIPADRLHVMRQGVDLDVAPIRERHQGLRVGYFGQVKHHKGVHVLLGAWESIEAPGRRELVLAGSGAGEESYERAMRARTSARSDVRWLGALAKAAVWEQLASLDAVVIPSIWAENSPNIILEAQAMGVPVIGSRAGGIAELVEHERNGLLFEPGDPADLARQLRRLLEEPSLGPRLRQEAVDVPTVAEEMAALFAIWEGVVAESRRGARVVS